jgi:putative nucleotidyltransferase with HDIG domain/PAS domain S-box-containing protein
MSFKLAEPGARIGVDEMDRILTLKTNLDHCASLIDYAAKYLDLGWSLVAIDAETGNDLEINFSEENWKDCLSDYGITLMKITLGVRTGSSSKLLVLEISSEAQKSLLDDWGEWRSPCVAKLGDSLEKHFYLMSPEAQPFSSNISITAKKLSAVGNITPLPPSLDQTTGDHWRWQDPPWDSAPSPFKSPVLHFLFGLQQPAAISSDLKDKDMISWLELYCRIAPFEAVTQAFNDQEASMEDYYETLLEAALEAGLTDYDTLCGLLWYAPWGDARSRAERWVQLQTLISRRLQLKESQLAPAHEEESRADSTEGGAGEGEPIFLSPEVMETKDTELPRRSAPAPVALESTSVSKASKIKWSPQQGPVLGKVIQEFSSILSELRGLIGELASQEEQKTAAEVQRQALEQHYQELFVSAPGGYLVTDADGAIQESNQAAAHMLQTDKEFLSGKSLVFFVVEEDHDIIYSLMDQAREKNEYKAAAVRFLHPKGNPMPCCLAIMGRKNPADELLGFNWLMHPLPQSRQDEETLNSQNIQLETYIKGLVKALSTATEMQNPYGSGHQKRVAQLSEAIAQEMGFRPDRVKYVKLMGLLHDIGKVAIPPEILNKTGMLTNTENNILKAHPHMGYVLLKDIEFPWPLAQAIHQHHERWDGSGYPSGLSGEDIIIEARILAVADAVENLVFPRPYRETMVTEKALIEIYKEMGVLYDPLAVEACLRVFLKRGFKFA